MAFSSISPMFHAATQLAAAGYAPPDVMFLSSDGVLFCAHEAVLMNASFNNFGGLLPRPAATAAAGSATRLDEDSQSLNLILYTAYGLSIAGLTTDWPTLTRAVSALVMRYGMQPPGPGDALFSALLSRVHLPGGAKQVFGFAAQHELDALAVEASAYLLPLPLEPIDVEWVTQVGAVYMRRLYFLHLGRTQALTRILSAELQLHAPTLICGKREMQEMVLGPWAYAIARLVMNPRPDLDPAAIAAALNPVAYRTPCAPCATAVRRRIEDIVREWSAVKKTI